MSRPIDMAGKKYSSLTGILPVRKMKNGNFVWRFLCDCGSYCEIDGYAVRSGKSTSCQKCAAERVRLASVKHEMSNTPEFSVWTDIQTRCYNDKRPEYKNYGGRGIKVCDRWCDSFLNFLSDMGNRPSNKHTIDRIENNGDYEPGNCRWATYKVQANNKRSNHKITINGVTKNRQEWADQCGLNQATIFIREKSGLTGEDLIAPSQRNGCLTFNGETNTYAGWAEKTGIKPSTIAMRISKYKWPVGKALTIGARL